MFNVLRDILYITIFTLERRVCLAPIELNLTLLDYHPLFHTFGLALKMYLILGSTLFHAQQVNFWRLG
jgi:hypothetical protein